MTLTLYSAHVWVVSGVLPEAAAARLDGGRHVLGAGRGMPLPWACVFAALEWRGPLEWVAHAANQRGRSAGRFR